MNYRINQKNGDNISLLGFGCMRFPKNEELTEKMIKTAVEKGVNYFDTAYIYPGSEAILGKILMKNNIREKVNIATKMPVFLVKKREDLDRYFNIQKERLKTEYIDYYLMHMLTSSNDWNRLSSLGVIEWIADKKKKGEIKNIGFSFHGGNEAYKALIDCFDWDFSMIQYNYFDENNQAGKNGLNYATEKGIPIIIMEPLRGGKLASKLPERAVNLFKSQSPNRSPAEWAFRWIFSHNQVMSVLSGMSNIEAVEENIKAASDTHSYELTDEQAKMFDTARTLIMKKTKVPCTGCSYCMNCPSGVDIPLCFSCYNDLPIEGRFKSRLNYIIRTGEHKASKCIDCGKCEQHCPQNIEIRNELKKVKNTMEGGIYRIMGAIIRKFMRYS